VDADVNTEEDGGTSSRAPPLPSSLPLPPPAIIDPSLSDSNVINLGAGGDGGGVVDGEEEGDYEEDEDQQGYLAEINEDQAERTAEEEEEEQIGSRRK
jgi:hypothetical protein